MGYHNEIEQFNEMLNKINGLNWNNQNLYELKHLGNKALNLAVDLPDTINISEEIKGLRQTIDDDASSAITFRKKKKESLRAFNEAKRLLNCDIDRIIKILENSNST